MGCHRCDFGARGVELQRQVKGQPLKIADAADAEVGSQEIELEVEENEIDTSDAVDVGDSRPHSPGGHADPGVYDDD